MKVLLAYDDYHCGETWHEYYDERAKEPPVEGAVLETFIKTETYEAEPMAIPHQEARLDNEGKPYIYTWNTYEPYQHSYSGWTLEGWNKHGFNHVVEKLEKNGKPHWKYTRKIKLQLWTVEITSIEQLEKLLDDGFSLEEESWSMPVEGFKYVLTR